MFAAMAPSPNARMRGRGLAVDGAVDGRDWFDLMLERGMAVAGWPRADIILRAFRSRNRIGKMGSSEYLAGKQRRSWRQHTILPRCLVSAQSARKKDSDSDHLT